MPGAGKRHSDTGGQFGSRSPTPERGDAQWLLGEPGMRCTCSSAGRQPTLGQRSPGETNPSAAQRASGRARLVPAARGSAQPLPPPPLSQTPASEDAVASDRGTLGRTPTSTERIPNSPGAATGKAETGDSFRGSWAKVIPSGRVLQAFSRTQPGECGCVCVESPRTGWDSDRVAPPTNT